jgi:hypothetical protein
VCPLSVVFGPLQTSPYTEFPFSINPFAAAITIRVPKILEEYTIFFTNSYRHSQTVLEFVSPAREQNQTKTGRNKGILG